VALDNPAFNNPAFQDSKAARSYPGRPGLQPPAAQTQTASAQHAGVDAAAQAQLEGMYAAPSAGAVETDRMTVEDTIWKTVGLFAVLLVTAVGGWVWTMSPVAETGQPTLMPWIIGMIGGFVLSLVVIFTSRKKIRPALIFAYAAFEGLFVGGISAVGVTLALFASGKIRASKKATKVFMIAMVGYLVFSLLNLVLMWTGVNNNPWGLLGEQIAGIPLGLIIGVLVVIMAAYSLVLDFDSIQQGVRNGAPRQYGWIGGFGIMVTVVWLYIEILRIIAIVRGSN
jgi:uncharacterized YccA/Bax inhibitor family protein